MPLSSASFWHVNGASGLRVRRTSPGVNLIP